MLLWLWLALLLTQGARFVGSMPKTGPGEGAPENITIMFLNHTSVYVNWSTNIDNVEKYDVTYKPTDGSFKVVTVVAGNSESLTLVHLLPNTQYQLVVVAVRAGKKFRSRQIVFRTLVDPDAVPMTGGPPVSPGRAPSSPAKGSKGTKVAAVPPLPSAPGAPGQQDFSQVRGVEVGIVLLVLVVWVGAIVLFFNRWGKIRMLLPYQPDYKEQLKVPGTGACGGGGGASCSGQHATTCSQDRKDLIRSDPVDIGQHMSRHHLHWPNHCSADEPDDPWLLTRSSIQIHRPLAPLFPLTRPRVNSAIYISSDHSASQSHAGAPGGSARTLATMLAAGLARRARSAENIPLRARTHSEDEDADDEDRRAKRRRRRGRFDMPVLSVSGPSPPGDLDELEQHL